LLGVGEKDAGLSCSELDCVSEKALGVILDMHRIHIFDYYN